MYSSDEIAQAAGASISEIEDRLRFEQVPTFDGLVLQADAVRLVRACVADRTPSPEDRSPLTLLQQRRRRTSLGLAASGALHAGFIVLVLITTSLGLLNASGHEAIDQESPPARLVFLMSPGPGGGGGGGGIKIPAPPRPAERKAVVKKTPSSPVPEVRHEVPPPKPVPAPSPPPVIEPPVTPKVEPPPVMSPPPAVKAPVAPMPADQKDTVGVPAVTPAPPNANQGAGSGGGAGAGAGRGLGDGTGSGIGPGSDGGTGGGPYRAGAGIEPPTLLREVKANYTEEARRQGIQGEVRLEIVVRRDGSVGSVRVLRGLGGGLDQEAIAAVRQWRFSPAKRLGAPVDVIAEVSVAFNLR